MATVNAAPLREAGKVSAEADAMFAIRFTLMSVLIPVMPERTARKSSASTGTPPSQTDKDETAPRREGREAEPADGRHSARGHRRRDGHRRDP